MSFVNLDPISTQVEFGDDFAKLARGDKVEAEAAAEAESAEAAADKSPESTSARLQRLRAEALESLRKGLHETFGGIECVAAAAGQADEAAAGARGEAAPAALLSDAERTRRLALAPPALLLMQEGAIEGERPPYEGLYRLDEGSFVNQRPLFRLTEISDHSMPRFLAFVTEGKVQTWAGQLDAHLGSTTAYLQLVDPTVPATPDRYAPSWQGAVWQDALSPEGQWTVRPKLRCTALTEEQTGAWAGIEVEGQLMATGIAISVVGFVDEEEFTEYVLHSILQADDGTMTEHRAKHRFSNFVQLHAAVQPSLAPYVPSKFPLGRMQVALTPAGKAAAKQKRGQQLQGYLRQLAAAAALKGVRRGGPRLYAFIDVNAWLHMDADTLSAIGGGGAGASPLLSAELLGAPSPARGAAPLLSAEALGDESTDPSPLPPPPPPHLDLQQQPRWRSLWGGDLDRVQSRYNLEMRSLWGGAGSSEVRRTSALDLDDDRDLRRTSRLSFDEAEGELSAAAGGAPLLDLDALTPAAEVPGAAPSKLGYGNSGAHGGEAAASAGDAKPTAGFVTAGGGWFSRAKAMAAAKLDAMAVEREAAKAEAAKAAAAKSAVVPVLTSPTGKASPPAKPAAAATTAEASQRPDASRRPDAPADPALAVSAAPAGSAPTGLMAELQVAEAHNVASRDYLGAAKVQEAMDALRTMHAALSELEATERAQVLSKQYTAAAATTELVLAARAKLDAEEARVRSQLLGGSGLV